MRLPRQQLCLRIATLLSAGVLMSMAWAAPPPPGRMVDLDGHRLHLLCSGAGRPTVVVENGLGDFSIDWALVQSQVARFARICTYDRAGYAWSEPGPEPRTFDQLNLELRQALRRAGERGPFVLVGHSFGGPVVRNFAQRYPRDVAGMVLVDAAFEHMRVGIGGGRTIRLGDGATGKTPPAPRLKMERAKAGAQVNPPAAPAELDPLLKALPVEYQQLHLWAQAQPQIEAAEASQREWSEEYFARWLKTSQEGSLGKLPLLVLTRAEGRYPEGQDVPPAQMEAERREGQAKLAMLSRNSRQVMIPSGHNMNLEAPDRVAEAIRSVVDAARHHGRLASANP